MSEPFIGEIRCFGFNFAPLGWAQCNGQLLSIAQNNALFAVLGTNFGGDGQTSFGLPALQGQVPMHWGTNAGVNTILGQTMGQPSVTLLATQIPQHFHAITSASVQTGQAAERTPKPTATSFLSIAKGGSVYKSPPVSPDTPFSPKAISVAGNSQPHESLQPYLVLNFCIALEGIFPQRS